MIPPLCTLFHVTSDSLLDIDQQLLDAEIDDIIKTALVEVDDSRREVGLTILREALKRYPNSYRIMDVLSSCLYNLAQFSEDSNEAVYEEACNLIERILTECTDTKIRNSAIYSACLTYPKVGRTEEAITIANSMAGAKTESELLSCIADS